MMEEDERTGVGRSEGCTGCNLINTPTYENLNIFKST